MTDDDFEEDGNRLYCVDPRGFGMTADWYQAPHFERGALLLCLARAYIRSFDDLAATVANVAAMGNSGRAEPDADQAPAARMAFSAIARFGAQYWFAHPVEPDRYSLIKVWRLISSTFHLDSRAQELQSQSQSLSHVLGEIEREMRLREERSAAIRNRRFSWIVSAFGTVVALLSLLDLLRTPWSEWQRIITGWFG